MTKQKIELNFKRAFACFIVAYCVVTIMAGATTIIYEILAHSPEAPKGVSILKAPAFAATVPYHVLIMLIVWPVFAWLYFRKRQNENYTMELKETLQLSFFWLIAAIIVDFIGFVLLRHPYSLTPFEFYVVYQPWISLIYISIFLSPYIRLGLSKLLTNR
jgi:hypothetical protein